MAYTTANLTTIIAQLEACLALGAAEIVFEGKKLVYRSAADILKAIAYFQALLPAATDASPNPAPKTRTFFLFGGKGIGL
jgi:hypothetical protein